MAISQALRSTPSLGPIIVSFKGAQLVVDLLLATAGEDGCLNLTSSKTGQKVKTFGPYPSSKLADQSHIPAATDCVFSSVSDHVASSYQDGVVRLFDLK